MPPRRGGICGILTSDLPLARLQGGLSPSPKQANYGHRHGRDREGRLEKPLGTLLLLESLTPFLVTTCRTGKHNGLMLVDGPF